VFYRSTDRCLGRLEGPSLLFYRWTDEPSRLEGPSLLFYRWTDGPSRLEGPSLLFYRWTDGPSRLEGPSLLFYRWTDVPTFYPFDRWSYALAMLRGFSFDRKTDGPLRVIFGRLTDGTYSTNKFTFFFP